MKSFITSLAIFASLVLTSATSGNVYITPSGKKYHTHQDCQYLRRSSAVKSVTISEAQSKHLTICSACDRKDNPNK